TGEGIVNHQNVQNAGNHRVDPGQIGRLVLIGQVGVDLPLARFLLVVVPEGVIVLAGHRLAVILPQSGPGGGADPELAGKVPAMIDVGDGQERFGQVPGIVVPGRNVVAVLGQGGKVDVLPAPHGLAQV